jgi:hypothetical protein
VDQPQAQTWQRLCSQQINGLLAVSLDANEQFCSDHRCCADCLSRVLTGQDAQGKEFTKTQNYHKQVYAQLNGSELSVILDFEPMRPTTDASLSIRFGGPKRALVRGNLSSFGEEREIIILWAISRGSRVAPTLGYFLMLHWSIGKTWAANSNSASASSSSPPPAPAI